MPSFLDVLRPRSFILSIRSILQRLTVGLCFLLFGKLLPAQTFVDATASAFPTLAGVGGMYYSLLAWYDYDQDGDLDAIGTGEFDVGSIVIGVYQNNGGVFSLDVAVTDSIQPLRFNDIAFADYNLDGLPDIAIAGEDAAGQPRTLLYRQLPGGLFTLDLVATNAIEQVRHAAIAWGDYDNDGDDDLLVTGENTGGQPVAQLYRNNGSGGFVEDVAANGALTPIWGGDVAWGDYDTDGLLDLAISGTNGLGQPVLEVFNNSSGTLIGIPTLIPGLAGGSLAWGDRDNDGDLDLLATGTNSLGIAQTILYDNGPGGLSALTSPMIGVANGAAIWGDYDLDGRKDILLHGNTGSGQTTRIYDNLGGGFVENVLNSSALANIDYGSVAWGDYDNDTRLDIILTGNVTTIPSRTFNVYKNTGLTVSILLGTPQNLQAAQLGSVVELSWDPPAGISIGTSGLTYNLYISNVPGQDNTKAALAGIPGGYRRVAQRGNMGYNNSWQIKGLSPGTYYWSVQLVDAAWQGRSFAPEQSFTIQAADFVDVSPSLFVASDVAGIRNGDIAWGDYDNDGDLDFVAMGDTSSGAFTRLFRNDGASGFVAVTTSLANAFDGTVQWADMNQDGWLDLLVAGDGIGGPAKIYQNNGAGGFADAPNPISIVTKVAADWGDFDNDGDRDLAISGKAVNSQPETHLYRNNGNFQFTQVPVPFAGLENGSVDWGDFDRDGDEDLLITGAGLTGAATRLYRNDGFNQWTLLPTSLPDVSQGDARWGDVNNDGLLDIVIMGLNPFSLTGPIAEVYLYDASGAGFVSAGAGLAPVYNGELALADFNDDGWTDILLSGTFSNVLPLTRATRLYRNTGAGGFVGDILNSAELIDLNQSSLAWGDMNNDGKLDILMMGENDLGNPDIRLYKNEEASPNQSLAAPLNLQQDQAGGAVKLGWDPPPGVPLTQVEGISYNLLIGSSADPLGVRSPGSDPSSGYRKIVEAGAENSESWILRGLTTGTYSWQVQAIDQDLEGSPFSAASTFNFVAPDFRLAPDSILFPSGTAIGLSNANLTWGDYDNDGDLDLFALGDTAVGSAVNMLLRNDLPTGFTRINTSFPNIRNGDAAWGDYDNDGWLDLVMAGLGPNGRITYLYQNDGNGAFTQVVVALPGFSDGSLEWGDVDRDGRLDLLMTGFTGAVNFSRIYRNAPAGFMPMSTSFTGVEGGIGRLADINKDGWLDVLISGEATSGPTTEIYLNSANASFSPLTTSISGYANARAAFGDFDNDGYLDLAIGGNPSTQILFPETKVYRFDPNLNSFVALNAGLSGLSGGAIDWGDYNDDGFMDLLITGRAGPIIGAGPGQTRLYRNTGQGGFVLDTINSQILVDVDAGADAKWVDINGNGKLDIAIAGSSGQGNLLRLYRNVEATPNVTLNSPQNLLATQFGAGIRFKWDPPAGVPASQSEGLTYNLYVGTTPGGIDALSPASDPGNGFRRIATQGNTFTFREARLRDLPSNTYYWSVQAIDQDLEGSPFAAEEQLVYVEPIFQDLTDSVFNPLGPDGLLDPALVWGDYNLDGNMDLVAAGTLPGGAPVLRFYENNGSTLSEDLAVGIGIAGVSGASLEWADVNADGRIDLLITGELAGGQASTRLLQNNAGGTFTPNAAVSSLLTDVKNGQVDWVDYDNDGDGDIFLSGMTQAGTPVSQFFQQDANGVFILDTVASALIPALDHVASSWTDYDRDGDLDLAISGEATGGVWSAIYRNEGSGQFVDAGAGLIAVRKGSLAWGDVDNDGFSDLLLTGESAPGANGFEARVYRYNSQSQAFDDLALPLPGLVEGVGIWGDYNDDGFADIVLAGKNAPSNNARITRLYRNDLALGFELDSAATVAFAQLGASAAIAWGDYNGDGKLDLAIAGERGNNDPVFRLYKNLEPAANSTPTAPANLQASTNGFELTLSWDPPAAHPSTTVKGLTYNVYLGTAVQSADQISPMAKIPVGFRRIVESGAQAQSLTLPLRGLPSGNYFWSVQAIDQDFEGSPFATEESVSLEVPTFLDVSPGSMSAIPGGFNNASLEWGDYDTDGDLDLILTGSTLQNDFNSVLLRQQAGVFSLDAAGSAALVSIANGDVAFCDYDNDGDLDLALTGGATGGGVSEIYQNNGSGSFSAILAGLPGLRQSRLDWGDYDNDGDADLLLTGNGPGAIAQSQVFTQQNGGFVASGIALAGVRDGDARWIDVDADGDLDIFLCGDSGAGFLAKLYENQGQGQFLDIPTAWTGLNLSSADWADYDNDGDPDLLLAGMGATQAEVFLYRNDAGTFVSIPVLFAALAGGDVAWGDYNDDGYTDVILSGAALPQPNSASTWLYQNLGGTGFVADSVNSAYFEAVDEGSQLAWADYDEDGKLDVVLAGRNATNPANNTLRLYRNLDPAPNLVASAPGPVQFVQDGFDLVLSWTSPVGYGANLVDGLTYNLAVGTAPGQTDWLSPMAEIPGGLRQLTRHGNVAQSLEWRIPDATSGNYVARIQAIEGDFEGSAFSAETSFTFLQPDFVDQTDSLFGGISIGLDSVAAAWGDYDHDGDLDLAASGLDGLAQPVTVLYRNDGTSFVPVTTSWTPLAAGSLGWVDYNRDGSLDFWITGRNAAGIPETQLYQNDGSGTFVLQVFPVPGLIHSALAWTDVDHDGDVDAAISGRQGNGLLYAALLMQDGGAFVVNANPFAAVENGSLEWMDYDLDGWDDLLLTGSTITVAVSEVYRNNGDGTFSNVQAALPGVADGVGRWRDMNMMAFRTSRWWGIPGEYPELRRHFYTGKILPQGNLWAFRFPLQGWLLVNWNGGDYDNDGWADVLIAGNTGSTLRSDLYRNLSGTSFVRDTVNSEYLADLGGSLAAKWADTDRDGKLDLLLMGSVGGNAEGFLYKNIEPTPHLHLVPLKRLQAR